ncbi:MAG: hypothetical protein R3B96_24305 [Pirellulaceae bacterium]
MQDDMVGAGSLFVDLGVQTEFQLDAQRSVIRFLSNRLADRPLAGNRAGRSSIVAWLKADPMSCKGISCHPEASSSPHRRLNRHDGLLDRRHESIAVITLRWRSGSGATSPLPSRGLP